MPVPSAITDLSTVAASNSPAGTESPATADDYFRAHASFIAQLRAVLGGAADANIPSVLSNGAYNLGVGQFAKNLIINGKMEIAQRGTSLAPGVGQEIYLLDRWFSYATGAGLTINKSSGPSTEFNSALAATGAAGNTGIGFYQRVESKNSADLSGKPVSIGAWVYSTDAITVTWYIFSADSVDNYSVGKTTRHTGTISIAAGWNYITIPISAFNATAALNGFQFGFGFPATSSSGIARAITGVQIELGTVSTSFDHRSYGLELALCQRYYETGKASIRSYAPISGVQYSNTFSFKVTKRTTPTTTLVAGDRLNVVSAYIAAILSPDSARLEIVSTSPGDSYALNETWTASAEL